MRKKNELSPAEQRRRFLKTARELGVDETKAAEKMLKEKKTGSPSSMHGVSMVADGVETLD